MARSRTAPGDKPLAGLARRAVATLLDVAILLFGQFLLALLFASLDWTHPTVLVFMLLWPIGYFTVGWSRFSDGQTLGKRAMDVEVVDKDGRYIGVGQAFARALASYVSALMLGLGYVWALWDRSNQSLHDKMAGTYVCRIEWQAPKPFPQSRERRAPCPRCGESIAVLARVCRHCSLELGEGWAE